MGNPRINIGNYSTDFVVRPTVDSNFSSNLSGITIEGTPWYDSANNTFTVYNTTLNLTANDVVIDQTCADCTVIGIATSGHGAYDDANGHEVATVNIDAKGSIKIHSSTSNEESTYAIENNSTGTITLSGAEVDLCMLPIGSAAI